MIELPRSFEDLIQTHQGPILVDFWAEWCGPCKMVAPVVEELAKNWKGRILVIKINTEEKPHIAARYGVYSIPTLILFKGGREIKRVIGAMPYPALKSQLEPYL